MCGCTICYEDKEDIHTQLIMKGRPRYTSFDDLSIITKQKKNNVFKIKKDEKTFGTGFFCLIPYPDKLNLLPVLFTCNHVLGTEEIKPGKEIQLFFNDKELKIIKIDENRKIYTSPQNEYDTTIIEIKDNDGFNINNILEIDYDIYEDCPLVNLYKNKNIYIIHYPLGLNSSYSSDIIKTIDINNIKIEHLCATEDGSSGAPILNLQNFKVIGIHLGNKQKNKETNINIGIVLRAPIESFNKVKKQTKLNKNIQDYIYKKINSDNKKDENKNSIILIENNEIKEKENKVNNNQINNIKEILTIKNFTWTYPDNTATGTPKDSVKIENGKISFFYEIENGKYGGCQTETKPGLGIGIDLSEYNMIKAILTNKGDSEIHCNIILKTGNGWTWYESAGTKILGGIENEEQIIKGEESIKVYYYLNHNFWKSQKVNWQYSDKIADLNDIRAIEFKVYNGGEYAKGFFEISDFEILTGIY